MLPRLSNDEAKLLPKNLYCKFFCSAAVKDEVIALIESAVSGSRDSTSPTYISGNSAELCVRPNEDFDPQRAKVAGDPNSFLYFPSVIDSAPNADATYQSYVKELKALVSVLRLRGYKIIPACDFEDEFAEE